VLVLEIAPSPRSTSYGVGSDFERASTLARFLSSSPELRAVKTVAYIPRSIKGHGVLVAMACEEIVMAPSAEFGSAGADEDANRPIEPVVVSLYQQIAAARRTIPDAIALGMLDARLEVHQVETEDATEFILEDEIAALEETSTIVNDQVLVPKGTMASFSGSEGRQFGFVKYVAEDRQALARVLQLPPEAVVEDQSLVGDWRPVMIDINGPITPRLVGQVKTLIAMERDQRQVNWIGLRIDSTGGELEDCLELAEVIAGQDPSEVRIVAYVPVEAGGGAAIVALACDQLVLQPDAQLGGPGTIEGEQPPEKDAGRDDNLHEARRTVLKSYAEDTGQSWSLLAAMFDPQVQVHTYTNTTTGEVRYMARAEVDQLPAPDDWRKGEPINAAGQTLKLDSERARDLGLAWQVVDSFAEFKQLYGFNEDPRQAEPNWALELVEALASPGLAVMLLVVGFIGIYLEMHSPGFGIGGFVAAVAFLLFFWSKFLHGTADWLEILLFVAGLFFLLLEIFVLPGFGVFGVGGAMMMIISLILASQTFVLPHSETDLIELRNSLAIVAVAGALIVGLAIALRNWLPHAPLFRTLLLSPPEQQELAELQQRESLADYAHLVGHRGKAMTQLLPSGKALVSGVLLDVIAEGDLVDAGQPIEVVSARANRVIVRAVDS
jgi:membrane-bound ClpP family serine protease